MAERVGFEPINNRMALGVPRALLAVYWRSPQFNQPLLTLPAFSKSIRVEYFSIYFSSFDKEIDRMQKPYSRSSFAP